MGGTKLLIPLLGVLIGGTVGYFYWLEIGCVSGTCPITSKPLNSTIYGGIMGYLLFDLVYDLIKKK